jgi:predicted RNA-binding protein
MCEANAYLVEDDQEQLLLSSVDVVEPDGDDSWRIVDIFGSQKIIKGRIKMMNLVDHKILFEKV